MDVPIIIVSDFEEDPPVSVKYSHGENELDLRTVYCNIKRLSEHPGRGRLETADGGDPSTTFYLKPCNQEFLDAFWDCASNLCDYFADFLAYDTATMQSVWYHMFDELQRATILPHHFWISEVPFCGHSQTFRRECQHLSELIMALAVPRRPGLFGAMLGLDFLYGARLNIDLGEFKAGLKMWQQFLYQDAPGFAVPLTERVYFDVSQPGSEDDNTLEVLVPRGGVALIDRHTKRLRELVEEPLEGDSDVSTEEDVFADFDQKVLKLGHVSENTSANGRQILIRPMHPILGSERAPRRLSTPFDPSLLIPKPSVYLINECVGIFKGKDVFQHPNDDEQFYMLSLNYQAVSRDCDFRPLVRQIAYSEMFDDWTGGI